jgi:hypothetical protein
LTTVITSLRDHCHQACASSLAGAGNARSGYRVRLADGKWHDVPNFALIDLETNKLGDQRRLAPGEAFSFGPVIKTLRS